MSDLISRQWLLDLYETPRGRDGVDWKVPLEVVQQNIKDAPSAEAVQEWIPVSEKLPKDSNMVLVTRYGYIELGKYENGEWFFGLDSLWLKTYGIIAWMPLPEPWKDGEEE